jgi:hypothetical protein
MVERIARAPPNPNERLMTTSSAGFMQSNRPESGSDRVSGDNGELGD